MPPIDGDIRTDADAIVCDMSAIPADERDAHVALARSLFFVNETGLRELDDGVVFELEPDRLADVAAFLENERRCCRHLSFRLDIPPRNARLVLRISGPGALDELRALVSD